jgi:hypothetical protein
MKDTVGKHCCLYTCTFLRDHSQRQLTPERQCMESNVNQSQYLTASSFNLEGKDAKK